MRVERFLACRQRTKVFEFGSGASAAWLARRAGEVHSVDDDLAFVDLSGSPTGWVPGTTSFLPTDLGGAGSKYRGSDVPEPTPMATTIVARNYLPAAKVLVDSYRRMPVRQNATAHDQRR